MSVKPRLSDIMGEEAIGWLGSKSPFVGHNPIKRQTVMAGESPEAAKARWSREAELERAMWSDPSRGEGGRKIPVRYDE